MLIAYVHHNTGDRQGKMTDVQGVADLFLDDIAGIKNCEVWWVG